MNSAHTSDVPCLAARLEKIERENRIVKMVGLILLLAVGAAVAMAQAPTKRTIVADEFVLKDNAGKVRARLYMDRGGPMLSLYDASGVERANLMQNEGTAGLILYHDPGERYGGAEMLLTPDGSTLFLNDIKHHSLVALTTWPVGPSLQVADQEGYSTIVGAAETESPVSGKSQETSAAAITLFGKSKDVIWTAP